MLLSAQAQVNINPILACIVLIAVSRIVPLTGAAVACNDTSKCQSALSSGSECLDGYCTNPFSRGCLRSILGEDYKLRTCNSQDDVGATCVASPLDYEEVRIAPNNWESAMFYSWIIQILLSETLDVPTSIETNVEGGALNFYDSKNGFAYPKKANPFDALYKANEVVDCLNTDEPCAHLIPEVWQGKRELNESAVEREGNGMVGHVGWYLPKFAAQIDPSVISYLGLVGETNRQKLADMFKRPMRWIDYCAHISIDNCTTNDNVVSRAPADETEGLKYFVKDAYTGHFIHTEKNNCTENPNCTGHMIDYPCTWSAYTEAQLYWNDIHLESDAPNGTDSYTYGEILEIIDAANVTKSPIIVVWWYPDPTMEIHDFIQLVLPKATRECLENRPDPPNRCNASLEELHGQKVGSCGYNTHSFEKYFARSFRESSIEVPIARRSPGHQLASNIQLSDVDISQMMVSWVNRGMDKWNYDPRDAVCTWVARNYEDGMKLKNFLPPGYPRVIHQEAGYNTWLSYFCTVFGVVGSVLSVAVGACTYHFRGEKQIKFAQEQFMYLLSLGFFFVGVGASVYGAVPSTGSCVARIWFVTIGFTLVYVPLLMKIFAINKLMNDSKNCRVTKVSKEKVYKVSGAVVGIIVLYLTIWTVFDTPTPESELFLRDESSNDVDVYIQCSSKSMIWAFTAFCWEGILICASAAVAYISRNITAAFNESRVLGNVAYVSFLFFVIRLIVFALPVIVLQPSNKASIYSILLTLESLVVIGLYFGVKFYSIYKHEDDRERDFLTIIRGSTQVHS